MSTAEVSDRQSKLDALDKERRLKSAQLQATKSEVECLLNKFLPALQSAYEAVKSLNHSDLNTQGSKAEGPDPN